MPTLDPRTTALVLIDLQQGIVSRDCAPRSSHEVVETAKNIAARFREVRAPVVLVHVSFGAENHPPRNVDEPTPLPPGGTPAEFSEFVSGLREPGDIVVLKHHWGAFIGTDLDLQLRRRGVKTIVLGGIATNKGVESTARSAWELSYDLVIPEDLCATPDAALHASAFETTFPVLARVVKSEDVAFEMG